MHREPFYRDYQDRIRAILAPRTAGLYLEVGAGVVADSMGLVADGLDMLADASVYGLALLAVGKPESAKIRAAFAMSPNSSPRPASGKEIAILPAASSRIFPARLRIILLMFRPARRSNMIAGRATNATTPTSFQS